MTSIHIPKAKKILVTGATSGLGRNAVDVLLNQGIPCIAIGRNQAVGKQLAAQGVHFVSLDLTQESSAKTLHTLMQGVDVVWHAAALSSPWGTYDDFYAANVFASRILATTACQAGVRRFIHISTPSVYFNYRHRSAIGEHAVANTMANHYAKTKRIAELTLDSIAKNNRNTQFIILRPRAIFGHHDRVLLPKIIELKRHYGYLPLPRAGAVNMDVTYAINVIHAMGLASDITFSNLSRPDPSLPYIPTYNITNGSPITLKALLTQLFDALNTPLSIKPIPYPLLAIVARTLEHIGNLRNKEPKLTAYSAGVLHYDMTLSIDCAAQDLDYHAIIPQSDAIAATANYLQAIKML